MKTAAPGLLEKVLSAIKLKTNWEHPIQLVHAVTARCNAGCEFCAWKYHKKDIKDELSTEEINRLHRDARKAGFFMLILWGGEPLVHHDIGIIARHANKIGFSTTLITNGFLLDHKMDEVVPYVKNVVISVDHPSEQHDEIRGMNGLYEKILTTTEKLKRKYHKTNVVFNYTLFKKNSDLDSIKEMARLAKSMGIFTVFNPLRIESASDFPEGFDLTPFIISQEELSASFSLLKTLKRKHYPIMNSDTYINQIIKGPPVYACHWPKVNLPVEANGDVVDCMNWGKTIIGNVRKESFREILKSPRLLALAGKEGENCHKCISIHRLDVSEVYEGNFEPALPWIKAFARLF